MKIVIATGIYPPEIGGPAEYAKNLEHVWKKEGHTVSVKIFSKFKSLPTGLRHIVYFFSLFPSFLGADFVLILDTFSCALPAVFLGKLLGKKMILRTGGDFLWEAYVERTGDPVLLRDFYLARKHELNIKEKVIFSLIRFVLQNVSTIIWSTEWQRDIFMKPYGLGKQKHFIVENYYGPRLTSEEPKEKNFIAATRILKWKNLDVLKQVFGQNNVSTAGAILNMKHRPHDEFIQSIRQSYAVIIPSLGDISPNTILDAIMCQKPFILTRENGLTPRIQDIALLVDPKDEKDIEEKVLWLLDDKNYQLQLEKIKNFTFVHSWEDIAGEYMDIYKTT